MNNSNISAYWSDKAKVQLNYPIESGLLQSRKIRALDLAMRDGPKARGHLDHLDPATDEDYFTVEAYLIERVLKVPPAIELLGISTVRALSSLNRDTRASAPHTSLACRRWKFVLKAIELIERSELEFPKGFFRELAKVDLEYALGKASNKDYLLIEIIEGLLETTIRLAMDNLYDESSKGPSEARQIFQKAATIARSIKSSAGALKNIVATYAKLTQGDSFKDVIHFIDTLSDTPHKKVDLIDTFASALARAGYPREAVQVLLLHNTSLQKPALKKLGNTLISKGQKRNALGLFQEAFRSHHIYTDGGKEEQILSLVKAKSLSVAEALAQEIASPLKRAKVFIDISDAFYGESRPVDTQRIFRLAMNAWVEGLRKKADVQNTTNSIIDRLPLILPSKGPKIFLNAISEIPHTIDPDKVEQVNKYKKSSEFKRKADNYARKGDLKKAFESIAKISIVSYQIEAYAFLIERCPKECIQRVSESIEKKVKQMTDQKAARMRLASAYAKAGFREEARKSLSPMLQMSNDRRLTSELENGIMRIVERGLYQEAYHIVKALQPKDRCPIFCKIAREWAKQDPKTGFELFNEAITAAQMTRRTTVLYTKISIDKMVAGFCVEAEKSSFIAICTLVNKANQLANIDLEAAEEVFQDIIGIARKQLPNLIEDIAEALANIGLNQDPLIEKTRETYPLVSAYYTMEVFKAKQAKDTTRLARLALRQAAYDPAIGRATCDNYRKV